MKYLRFIFRKLLLGSFNRGNRQGNCEKASQKNQGNSGLENAQYQNIYIEFTILLNKIEKTNQMENSNNKPAKSKLGRKCANGN